MFFGFSKVSYQPLALVLSAFALSSAAFAQAGSTWLVPGYGLRTLLYYTLKPSISGDGRFVVFNSDAADLVPSDTNNRQDIFLYDRQLNSLRRISVSNTGEQALDHSAYAQITANGRYVAFPSKANNLVAGDSSGDDIFLYNLQTNLIERIVCFGPSLADYKPAISEDGYSIVAQSEVTGLNLSNRQTGYCNALTFDNNGTRIYESGSSPAMSADGRYVAFDTGAQLIPEDNNSTGDIYIYDRQTQGLERVSLSSSGQQGNATSFDPDISADGRFVTFVSKASNLVVGDTNEDWDVFVHDRQTHTTERVSVSSTGAQANLSSYQVSQNIPTISADGRFVAFYSIASSLVPGDTNELGDIFVRDLKTKQTIRVSVSSTGEQSNGESFNPSISADGRFVTFASYASNLAAGDKPSRADVFVHQFREITPGDLDNNGCVDDLDLFALTQDFLSAPGSFSGKDTDLNNDGIVDDFDLFTLTQHFLEGC